MVWQAGQKLERKKSWLSAMRKSGEEVIDLSDCEDINADQSSAKAEEKLNIRWIEWDSVGNIFSPHSPVLDQCVHKQRHHGGGDKLHGWFNSMELLLPVSTWLMHCLLCNISIYGRHKYLVSNTALFLKGSNQPSGGGLITLEVIIERIEICSHYIHLIRCQVIFYSIASDQRTDFTAKGVQP